MTKYLKSSDSKIVIEGSGAVKLPAGPVSNRPIVTGKGWIRFNDVSNELEVFNGTVWNAITGGGGGGGPFVQIAGDTMTGQLEFLTTTPFAPAIAFIDPNTGIYASATGTLSLSLLGNRLLKLENFRVFLGINENVVVLNDQFGIGTDSPQYSLSISAVDAIQLPAGATSDRPGTTVDGLLRYNNSINEFEGFSNGSWVTFNSNVDQIFNNTKSVIVNASGNLGDGIDFYTNSALRMVITSAGRVGIGTISPTELLQIKGTAKAVQIIVSGSEGNYKLPTSGGTAGQILVTNGPGQTSYWGSLLTPSGEFIANTSNTVRVDTSANTKQELTFTTNTSVRMTITSAGRVGIGTTTPSATLHVFDALLSSSFILLQTVDTGTADTDGVLIGISAPGLDLVIRQQENASITFDTNLTQRMVIANNGRIGINTPTPSEQLEILGTAKAVQIIVSGQGQSYKLPTSAGVSGQFLRTRGNGLETYWSDVTGGAVTLSALGGGANLFLGVSGGTEIRHRTIVGSNIEVSAGVNTIIISALPQNVTVSSLGGGESLAIGVSANREIQLRSLVGGGTIDVSTSGNTINISANTIVAGATGLFWKVIDVTSLSTGTSYTTPDIDAYTDIRVRMTGITPAINGVGFRLQALVSGTLITTGYGNLETQTVGGGSTVIGETSGASSSIFISRSANDLDNALSSSLFGDIDVYNGAKINATNRAGFLSTARYNNVSGVRVLNQTSVGFTAGQIISNLRFFFTGASTNFQSGRILLEAIVSS